MADTWREVQETDKKYWVSFAGDVLSLEWGRWKVSRIMKPAKNLRGYYHIRIGGRVGKFRGVHQLVAQAWIPNPDDKPMVNHKDGDKLNNNVKNLEWVTAKENVNHAWRMGLMRPSSGRAVTQMLPNGNIVAEFECIMDAERATGIWNTNISHACRNSHRRAGGYRWGYK